MLLKGRPGLLGPHPGSATEKMACFNIDKDSLKFFPKYRGWKESFKYYSIGDKDSLTISCTPSRICFSIFVGYFFHVLLDIPLLVLVLDLTDN